jgi:steroid delta-isomerase-like uncharacterized protein
VKEERFMSTEENKALARRAWEVVFNQRNLDALSEFYTADALWHQPDQDLQGLEEVKQWLARPFEAFPDLNVSVEDVIAEGDKVVIRYTSRGTHQGETGGLGPPTGRRMELEGLAMQRFEGNKIVEFWDRFDTLSLLEQLGLAPEQ